MNPPTRKGRFGSDALFFFQGKFLGFFKGVQKALQNFLGFSTRSFREERVENKNMWRGGLPNKKTWESKGF